MDVKESGVAGDYVPPSSDRRRGGGTTTQSLSYTQSLDDSHTIRFVDEQYHPSNKIAISAGSISTEVVQNAFNEYRADINQSLSELDAKINRLENMISQLVERIPAPVSTNPNHNQNNHSPSIKKNNVTKNIDIIPNKKLTKRETQ